MSEDKLESPPSVGSSGERITLDILMMVISNDLGVSAKLIEVDSFNLSKGAKLGDGFVCDVKRIDVKARVDGTPLNLNYIAKLKPTDAFRQQMLKDMTVFEAECRFYDNVSNQLQKLRKEKNLKPLRFAKCYYASGPEGVLVLENLKEDGFQVPEKNCKGLSKEWLETILVRLAELHATTYHFLQRYPGGRDGFLQDEPLFSPCTLYELGKTESMLSVQRGWMTSGLETIVAVLRDKDGGNRSDLADLLVAQKDCCADKAIAAAKPKPGDFLTILHGDMWYNNVMFKPTEDVVFIDFQLVNVSNPGSELAYFLNSSSWPAVRKEHVECWLRLYHTAISQDLVAFGYPENTYAYAQVKCDYRHARYHGLMAGLQHSSVLLVAPDTEVVSCKDLEADGGTIVGQDIDQVRPMFVASARKVPHFMERTVDAVAIAHEEGLV